MRTNGTSRIEGTIIALAVTGVAATGHAGLVSWDGGGDDSTWHDSMNWTGNAVPGAADDVVIAAGETVSFSSFTTETVSSIACDGSLVLTSGTLVVDGDSVVNELTISNGTWDGAGDLTINGLFTWTAGAMRGGGTTFADGGLALSGGGLKSLFRDLENAGTANWTGGQFRISDPATFTNLPGAVFDHQADNLLWWDSGSPGTFDNQGIFRKSAGANDTDIRVIFANTGTFEVLSGKVIINEGYTQTAGAMRVDTELEFALGNQMDLLGGIACGNGLIDGFVNNDGGTINPGLSPGTLNVEGDVDQSFFGGLVVELGGPRAGEHDVLAIDGDAFLGGLLDIRRFNGYQPAVGTVFTVLTTAGSRIDTFDETFCDAYFDIRYLAQAVELEVIAELPIADINQDCSVGFADLAILLGTWGPCPKGEFCAADFDLDGTVGFNDLSFLLGNWG